MTCCTQFIHISFLKPFLRRLFPHQKPLFSLKIYPWPISPGITCSEFPLLQIASSTKEGFPSAPVKDVFSRSQAFEWDKWQQKNPGGPPTWIQPPKALLFFMIKPRASLDHELAFHHHHHQDRSSSCGALTGRPRNTTRQSGGICNINRAMPSRQGERAAFTTR